ncbi:MAG: sulfotransferase [Trueperaceae bacterium]
MRYPPRPCSEPDRQADHSPFFVIGADRSGTTLLRLYLNAHTRLAIPSESWFLIDLFRAFPPPDKLFAEDVARAVEIVTSHPRYRDGWSVPPATVLERFPGDGAVTTAEFVDTLYRLEVGADDRLEIGAGASVRWGDKTPEYVMHVEALDHCFPRAQFVHIVRDGRDVFLSLANRRWSDRGWSPHEVGRYWSRVVRAAAEAEARLGPDRFLRVRYEDLVLDTQGTLERVCAYLGVSFEPAMLDAHQGADAIKTALERERHVHDRLGRAPRRADVERWRHEGAPWRRALVESLIGRELGAYGYPDVPPGWRRIVLRPAAAAHFAWTRRARPFARRVTRGLRRRVLRR